MKKRNKVSAEFNMSSLTDIIFLLLIFFMITSTLVSPNVKNLDLPQSDAQTVAPATISVSINNNGQFFIGQEEVRRRSLEGRLNQEISTGIKEEGAKNLTLTIVAEVGVPFEDVTKVLAIAEKRRIKTILATNPIN